MKLALLIAWLVVGGWDAAAWWESLEAVEAAEIGDVSKMDGGTEPPPKP